MTKASRSALADALKALGSDHFGGPQRKTIANALDIVIDEIEEPLRDEAVEEFMVWLLEHPRHLGDLRSAHHNPLSQLGTLYRKFTADHGPATPARRLRRALLDVVDADPKQWFHREPDHHIRLAGEVVGAWPMSLLKIDRSEIHPEALAHAMAALLSEVGRSMTPLEMARALLDHFPDSADARMPGESSETIAPGGPVADMATPENWARQHAAQILCRFTHEELILVAARLRGEPEAQTAEQLGWPLPLVTMQSQWAWDRLEEHLGLLQQSTGQDTQVLVRVVEDLLLDMDM